MGLSGVLIHDSAVSAKTIRGINNMKKSLLRVFPVVLVVTFCVAIAMLVHAGDEEDIDDLFTQLKSGNVTNETAFIEQHLLPFGQTTIDVLLPKLMAPRVTLENDESVENDDILPAASVFAVFGDMAFSNLYDHVAETNDSFRANVLLLIQKHEREECFGILTNSLLDSALVAPGDHRVEPLRICDEAYLGLSAKIQGLGFPLVYELGSYYNLPIAGRDQRIAELQAWWGTNGLDVIERFNQQ